MQRSSAWEGWSSTLLLALVGGIVAVSPQLPPGTRSLDNSARSLVPDERTSQSFVWARSWEDPLLAVSSLEAPPRSRQDEDAPAQHHLACGVSHGDPARCIGLVRPDQLPSSNLKHQFETVRVVVVEMLGGDGAEDEEDRRGCRRAILQGMSSSGFSPHFRGRLFPVLLEDSHHVGIADRLATEYFKRNNELCVVAYVPMRVLIDRDALGLCECIALQMYRFADRELRHEQGRLQLDDIVIVRRDSRAMMDDLAETATTWTRHGRTPVRVFNFASTIDTSILEAVAIGGIARRETRAPSRLAQQGDSWNIRLPIIGRLVERTLRQLGDAGSPTTTPDQHPEAILRSVMRSIGARETIGGSETSLLNPVGTHGWQIGRMLGSDARLIEQLVDELRLRRRSPNNSKNAVAIITEAGHPYSDEFYAKLQAEVISAGGSASPFETTRDPMKRLYHLKFSAGLDIPPMNEAGRQAYRMYADPSNEWGHGAGTSTPLGMHGIDYVFRQLRDVEVGLEHEQRLAAIIICATDERDKRPLIQLIKREFPNTLVMTSDLHALMTDPSDLQVMRNVIVASHLDLRAGSNVQDSWAPFRSAYQTSLFLGIRTLLQPSTATGDAEPAAGTNPTARALAMMDTAAPAGRIYEIGEQGAVSLNQPTSAGADAAYYPPAKRAGDPRLLVLLALLAGLALLPQLLRRNAGDGPRRAGRSTARVLRTVGNEAHLNRWWRGNRDKVSCWLIRWGAPSALIAGTFTLLGVAYLERREHIGLFAVIGVVAILLAVSLGVRAWAPARIRAALFQLITRPLATTTFVGRSWLSVLAMLGVASFFGLTTFTWGIVGVIGCAALLMMLLSTFADQPGRMTADRSRISPIQFVQPVTPTSVWNRIHARGLWFLFAVFTTALVGLLVFDRGSGPRGEPWGWFDGVSAWPSMLIRLAAVFLGVWFVLRCCKVQAALDDRATCVEELRPGFQPHLNDDERHADSIASHYQRVTLTQWNTPMVDRGTSRERVCVASLLRQLHTRCEPDARFVRLSIFLAMITAVVIGAMAIVGIPDAPVRGRTLYVCHVALMWAHAVILNLTVLAMLDTTLVSAKFVQHLYGHQSEWPAEIRRAAEARTGVHRDEVSPWLDIRSVANLTRDVNGLVYFPMILILLSAAAWHPSIDAWTINWLMIVIYGVSLPLCVVAAYLLRRTARRLPEYEIERLETRLTVLNQHDERILTDLRESVERNPDCQIELKLGPNPDLYLESLRIIDPQSDVFDPAARRGDRQQPDELIPTLAAAIVAYAGSPVASAHAHGADAVQPDTTLRVPLRSLADPRYAPLLPALQRVAASKPRQKRRDAYIKARCAGIRTLIGQIERVKDGAFAPWTEDPIFRGVAAPVIGFIAVKASEMMGFSLM